MRSQTLTALLCAALLPLASPGHGLGLDGYLDQVRSGNPALRGQRAEDAALGLSAKAPLTAYSPQLNANAQYQDDQELAPGDTELYPADQEALTWDANLSKLFSTGTKVTLDYSGSKNNLLFPGDVAEFASNPDYAGFLPYFFTDTQQWNIAVSQSLWRGFGGSQVGADLDKAAADAAQGRAENAYQAQALLLRARQAYVALETDRAVAALYAESQERAKQILDWTKRKVDDDLSDEADLLESQAALEQDGLELDQARTDAAKDAMDFNALRGRAPVDPVEDLDGVEPPAALPAARPGRLDLKAAEAALRSSEAEVRSVVQSFTPDLSVFAQVGDAELSPQATGPGLDGGFRPDTLVGVKLSANLDFLLYRQIVAGARQAQGYGAAKVEDARLQVARDWAELDTDFGAVRARLDLARRIEDLRRRKALRENSLYLDGRTTHFQVLLAQSDYDQARIQVLRLQAAAYGLYAQARYYNGDDRPW